LIKNSSSSFSLPKRGEKNSSLKLMSIGRGLPFTPKEEGVRWKLIPDQLWLRNYYVAMSALLDE